jgi:hypothetical protein
VRRIRPLGSLLLGLASLGLALLMAGYIEQGVQTHLSNGNPQLAADSLAMLWSPAIFALTGILILLGVVLQLLRLLGSRIVGPRQGLPRGVSRSPSPPPAPTPSHADPYRLACRELGVDPGSSWASIRNAWRRGLLQWHPDAGGDPEHWHRRLAAYSLLQAWEAKRP